MLKTKQKLKLKHYDGEHGEP